MSAKNLRIRISVVEMNDDYSVSKKDELHIERIIAAEDYESMRFSAERLAEVLSRDLVRTIANEFVGRRKEEDARA